MIELHVEPRVSKTWDDFLVENPPYSIALDGYVSGRPEFAKDGPHANFDHHAGVDRLCTRSTCMQVCIAIRMGLFEVFQKDGRPFANVYVNDPDQDTCLAVWQLRYPERLGELNVVEPVARLLMCEDVLDCTGGAYPISPDRLAMREQAWVFEPYVRARFAGRVPNLTADEMRALIDEVCGRITDHADGRGEKMKLDTRFEEIGGGPGWKMIVEHGPYARLYLMGALVRAFVSVRDNGDGTWTYSIGRVSPFVPFPIDELYAALNAAEERPGGPGGWGGSNTIGGSPRDGGSRLAPPDVERVINACLTR